MSVYHTLRLIFPMVFCCAAATAQADGLRALEQYLQTAQHGTARFTQTTTGKSKKGSGVRSSSKESQGTFSFIRPSQFRFDYEKPLQQYIVADGKYLWTYDVALNQVTQRNQKQALAATPAALLTSARSLAALQSQFKLENEPVKDSLQWVRATPVEVEGVIQYVLIGFQNAILKRLIIVDSFGQESSIQFEDVQSQKPSVHQFQFQPPKDATLLRQDG